MRDQRALVLDNEAALLSRLPREPANCPEITLQDLSDAVRNIYIACRRDICGHANFGNGPIPSWDGGEDSFGRVHGRNRWIELAARISELGADPFEFIQLQFVAKQRTRPPMPADFLSELAAAGWRQHEEQRADVIARLLASDNNSFDVAVQTLTTALQWEQSRAIVYALNNTSMVNITPLFRYCAAAKFDIPEIAARFFSQAMLQYVFRQRLYDSVWGDAVPPRLRQEAQILRNKLLGQATSS